MPPNHLNLLKNDVHIWRLALEQPLLIQKLADTLSEDETIRANRFYFERDKQHFTIGRGLLRELLGRYLDIEPKQLQFVYNPSGKPALASRDFNRLQFNLSHSEGMVLYAFTRDRKIGIDLEYIRPIPDLEQLIQRFFSVGEAEAIASLPPSEQLLAFFQIWTCKEAYLKATGEGLAQLQQVEISLVPEKPHKLLNKPHWSLQTLNLSPNYTAALVVEGHDWNLTDWQCELNL